MTLTRLYVLFTIEVDFLGDGSWHSYGPKILVGSDGYSHFEFPDGFSAQWVRLKASRDCTATAQFYYT